MKIETRADLKALIRLCQTQGVRSISVDGITIELNDPPQKAVKRANKAANTPVYAPGGITEDTSIDTPDALTPEQLLFYSAVPTNHEAF